MYSQEAGAAATASRSATATHRKAMQERIAKDRMKKRIIMAAVGVVGLAGATHLFFQRFGAQLAVYVTPTQLLGEEIDDPSLLHAFLEPGQVTINPPSADVLQSMPVIRVGGMVKPGSFRSLDYMHHCVFILTDLMNDVAVIYRGDAMLPDLFKEGQSVVVEGHFDREAMLFRSNLLIAKHDENYVSKDIAELMEQTRQKMMRIEELKAAETAARADALVAANRLENPAIESQQLPALDMATLRSSPAVGSEGEPGSEQQATSSPSEEEKAGK
ncbi:hypothetical protein, variant [Fonticula alba]|nr:hypothetical protein, variant [Fonticula alba]KCV69148.1 hypothetical protein, variant [Fonticula alba]|eukprot:XP_009496719.1 hypothetical protein, variant [Fonticula alba]